MKRVIFLMTVAVLASSATAAVTFGQSDAGKQETAASETGKASAASDSGGSQFGQMGQRPWFMHKSVRPQLQMTEAQYELMVNNYSQGYYEYQISLAEIDKDLMPQVRREQAKKLYDNFLANFDTSLNSVFTDHEARQRYDELKLQYDGYRAFGDPALQSRMKLTPDQIRQFNQYQNDLDARYGTLQQQYASDPVAFSRQYQQLMTQRQDQISRTLTADQRQLYDLSSGEPYKFTPEFYFSSNSQLGASNLGGSVSPTGAVGGVNSTPGSSGATGTSGGAAGGAGAAGGGEGGGGGG